MIRAAVVAALANGRAGAPAPRSRRGVRALVVLSVTATLCGVIVAAPPAAATADPPPARSEPSKPEQTKPEPPPPPDEPRRGEELVQARTANSKTFATGDAGVRRTEFHGEPIHYREGAHWLEIDETLADAGAGRRRNRANAFTAEFADDHTARALGRVEVAPDTSVGWRLLGARPGRGRTTPDGAALEYRSILPHVDLRQTSGPEGVKEEIVLRTKDAPRVFQFALALEGLTASIDTDGNLVYRDGAGRERLRTPAPFMTDSALGEPGEGNFSGAVDHRLVRRGGVTILEVHPDEAWLDDPSREYPVVIDPTLLTNRPQTQIKDTYFTNDMKNDVDDPVRGTWNTMRVGLVPLDDPDPDEKTQSYLKFDLAHLEGKDVTDARLKLRLDYQAFCEGQMQIWRVLPWSDPTPSFQGDQEWDENDIKWPPPGGAPSSSPYTYNQILNFTPSSAPCTTGWLTFADLGGLVQGWADNAYANYGVGLVMDNDVQPRHWKRLRTREATNPADRPVLEVSWYEPEPSVPTNLKPKGPINTTTPTLEAKFTDPNQDTGRVHFRVDDLSAGGTPYEADGSTVSSGGTSVKAVPSGRLTAGRTYRLWAYSIDQNGVTSSWTSVDFTILGCNDFVPRWEPRVTSPTFYQSYLPYPGYPPDIVAEGYHSQSSTFQRQMITCLRDSYLAHNPPEQTPTQAELDDLANLLYDFVFAKDQINALRPSEASGIETRAPADAIAEVIPPGVLQAFEELTHDPLGNGLPSPPLGLLAPLTDAFDVEDLLARQGDRLPPVPLPTTPSEVLGQLTSTTVDALDEVEATTNEVFDQVGINPPTGLIFDEIVPLVIAASTYRVCSESATKPTSCSDPIVAGTPYEADVTGDGTLDVVAQLTPAPDPLHPGGVSLRDSLVRLPTSETAAGELEAHVWFLYEPPATSRRLALGFDGFRRGAGLSDRTELVYTLKDPIAALNGDFLSHYSVSHVGPASSWAVTFGLRTVAPTDGATSDPIEVSALQTPVPASISGDVDITGEGAGDSQTRRFRATANPSQPIRLDLIGVARRTSVQPERLVSRRAIIRDLPTSAAVDVIQQRAGDSLTTDVDFSASDRIARVALASQVLPDASVPGTAQKTAVEVLDVPTSGHVQLAYTPTQSQIAATTVSSTGAAAAAVQETSEGALEQSVAVRAEQLPTQFAVTNTHLGDDGEDLVYTADRVLPFVEVANFNRDANRSVGYASLLDVPTSLTVRRPAGEQRIIANANAPVGPINVRLSRGGGRVYVPAGEHATLRTGTDSLGASVRVSGLTSLDASYRPGRAQVTATLSPGGQPFLATGLIDGRDFGLVRVSNLPRSLDVVVEPDVPHLRYATSDRIEEAEGYFTDLITGPTAYGRATGLPSTADVTATLGDVPTVAYRASESLAALSFVFSPDTVTTVDTSRDRYLLGSVEELPTSVDGVLDLNSGHVSWTASGPTAAMALSARGLFGEDDEDLALLGAARQVPAQWDADFPHGLLRFRGLSGPIGAAYLAATNTGEITSYEGSHVRLRSHRAADRFNVSAFALGVSSFEYRTNADDVTLAAAADLGGERLVVDGLIEEPADAGGDTDEFRKALRGQMVNVPTDLKISWIDGKLTYDANGNLTADLEAEYGWVAALDAADGRPDFPGWRHGVSAQDSMCASSGPGCRPTSERFCEDGECYGIEGRLSRDGLPTHLELDLDARTLSLTNLANSPRGDYLEGFAELNHLTSDPVKFLLHQEGIPPTATLNFGPLTWKAGEGRPTELSLETNHTSDLGPLRLLADLPNGVGDVRDVSFDAVLSNVPARLDADASFGQVNHIEFDNSAPLGAIDIEAFGTYHGTPAKAMATLDQVPPVASIDVRQLALDDDPAARVPELTYTASDNTLDGEIVVDTAILKETAIANVVFTRVLLGWNDLGKSTTVDVVRESTGDKKATVHLVSSPATGRLYAGASVLASTARIVFNVDQLTGPARFFRFKLDGHVEASAVNVGAAKLAVEGFSDTTLVTKPPYLGYGVVGNYDRFTFDISDLALDLDIDVTVEVRKGWRLLPWQVPAFKRRFDFAGRYTEVASNELRQEKGETAQFKIQLFHRGDFGCLRVHTQPHRMSEPTINQVHFGPGVDGDPLRTHSFTILNPVRRRDDGTPVVEVPPYLFDLAMSHVLSPLATDQDYNYDTGGCPYELAG